MFFYPLSVFLFFILSTGCELSVEKISAEKNSNIKNVVIPKPLEIKEANIIENLEYIILEAKDNAFLTHISKLRVYNNRIFIYDLIGTKNVFIYSIDGKHIATVGNNRGQGPLDFVEVYNFEIDYVNNQLLVMDNFGQKFMIYDFDGNFIKRVGSKLRVGDAILLSNGNIVHAKSSDEHKLSGQNKSSIFIVDDNQKIIKEGFEYDDNKSLNFHSYDIIRSLSNGDFSFSPRFRDTIYSITFDSIVPKYAFNYGNNKKISYQELADLKDDMDMLKLCKEGRLCFFGANVESKDYLFIELGFYYNTTAVFFNKHTSKTIAISIGLNNKIFEQDLYKILCSDDDNYFYGAFNRTQIDDLIKIFPELQHLDNLDDLNPILFRYKIKNVE